MAEGGRGILVGPVDEPVVPFDLGPAAARGLRKGRHRPRSHRLRNLHQTGAQAGIAEIGAPELRLGPGRPVEPVRRIQRSRAGRRRTDAHAGAPVPRQLMDIDRLAPGRHFVAAVLPAAARGLAQAPPVGRPQAGAVEGRRDEGLDQPRREAEARGEVGPEAAQKPAERMRGQIAAAHVRSDQEPGQADHPVQMVPARRRVPADPAVPRRELQGRRRHPCRTEPAVLGPQEIPQLPADQRPGAPRMLAVHQPMPDLVVRRVRDQNQRETPDLADLRRNIPRRRHRRRPAPPDTGSSGSPPGRKPHPAGPLQGPQGRQAGGDLRPPAAVTEAEFGAQPSGKSRAVRNVARFQNPGDMAHRLRPGKLMPDLMLSIHGRHRRGAEIKCPASLVGHG